MDYLIKIYKTKNDGNPELSVLTETETFKRIHKAKEDEELIVVFAIDICVLDWS
jgi:hypothetical protein